MTAPPSASSTPESADASGQPGAGGRGDAATSLPWSVDDDVLVAGPLRAVVQAIGLDAWRADGTLRSWGVVPLHRSDGGLIVPCGPGVALWIGAWLEPPHGPAADIELSDAGGGRPAVLRMPGDDQLAGVLDATGTPRPLALADATSRVLALRLRVGPQTAALTLRMLRPAAWSERSGRVAPTLRTTPPPLPPRLG